MTVDAILDYAERNHSFHSDYAVCAGPRAMVREFLQVLIEGRTNTDYASVILEEPMSEALRDLDSAIDYALYGLRAYAAVFSLWPAMTRAYEQIAAIAATWSGDDWRPLVALRERMRDHLDHVKQNTLLGSEEWRVDRERVYADMYDQCGRGLQGECFAADLRAELALISSADQDAVADELHGILLRRLRPIGARATALVRELSTCIMDFLVREQAVLRTASAVQAKINRLLGRTPPERLFSAADIDVHNLLLGVESRRLPYLIDELEQLFGIGIVLDPDSISISQRATEA